MGMIQCSVTAAGGEWTNVRNRSEEVRSQGDRSRKWTWNCSSQRRYGPGEEDDAVSGDTGLPLHDDQNETPMTGRSPLL